MLPEAQYCCHRTGLRAISYTDNWGGLGYDNLCKYASYCAREKKSLNKFNVERKRESGDIRSGYSHTLALITV